MGNGDKTIATPFLKWAGGKGQLLQAVEANLPKKLKDGSVKKYFEPMVGGGAVFFFIAQNFNIPSLYISDRSEDLILSYSVIQRDPSLLIAKLKETEAAYHKLNGEKQKAFFYKTRDSFNEEKRKIDFSKYSTSWVNRCAQIIFLNRTCFNGLFRVNSKGLFNVPFGKYKNPRICFEEKLKAISSILGKTNIRLDDYSACMRRVDDSSFVYFDPPYRPLNQTSSFNSYSKGAFDDTEQLRLAEFYKALDKKGALLMLSNSDPRNTDPKDDFFERAYSGFNIKRISATRMINSKSQKRGAVSELLIMNYKAAAN